MTKLSHPIYTTFTIVSDFVFHMTLHIDKDYNKVLNLQKILKENFKPFFLEFNTLALFDYPGEMIKKINLNEK